MYSLRNNVIMRSVFNVERMLWTNDTCFKYPKNSAHVHRNAAYFLNILCINVPIQFRPLVVFLMWDEDVGVGFERKLCG